MRAADQLEAIIALACGNATQCDLPRKLRRAVRVLARLQATYGRVDEGLFSDDLVRVGSVTQDLEAGTCVTQPAGLRWPVTTLLGLATFAAELARRVEQSERMAPRGRSTHRPKVCSTS